MHYLKKELYELIKEDERIFDFIQEGSLDGLWYWDLEKPENEWMNERFWNVLGYDPEEMPHLASAWQDIINQDDLKAALDNFHKHLEDPKHPYDQNVRYTHKNGSTVWVRCRGLAIRDESGKPVRMLGAHQNITDLKNAENKLSENENLFRTLFEQSSVGIARLTPDGKFIQVNKKFGNIIGYTPEEMLSMNFVQITHPDDLHLDDQYITKVLANEIDEFTIEKRYIHKNKSIIWIQLNSNVIRDSKGNVLYAIASILDITDRKQADDAIHESEEKFRLAIDNSPLGISMNDMQGNFISTNPAYENMLGYSKEELKEMTFFDVTHPDDRRENHNRFNGMASDKMPGFDMEKRYIRKDGSLINVFVHATSIHDDKGKPVFGLAFVENITKRKQAEIKLRMLNQAIEHSLNAFDIVSHEGKLIYVNQAYVDMWGYDTIEEIIGTSPISHCEDTEMPKKIISEIRKNGQFIGEFRAKRKDGTLFDVLMYARLDHDEKGNEIYPTTSLDITEQKQATQKLKKSEEKFITISKLSTDYSYSHLYDEKGNITLEWSFGAFEEITGYKPEEMVKPDQVARLIHPDDMAKAGQRVERILKGETVVSELRIMTKNGKTKWIRDKGMPEWDKEKKRVIRCIGTVQEITEQKNVEFELIKQRDLFELVINSAPTRIFWKDLNSVYLGCNKTFAEDAGFDKPSDIIGKNDDDLVWKMDADKYRADDQVVMQTGKSKLGYEEAFVNIKGEKVIWRTGKKPLKDLNDKIIGIVAVSENITQEKIAIEKLKKSESKLKSIIENSTNLFYIHSISNEMIYVSPQVREYLGYEPDEVLKRWDRFITDNPMNAEGIHFTEQAIQTGEQQPTYELEMQRKDGRKIIVEVREAPIVEQGEVVKIVGSLTDITVRKKAENALRRSEALLREAQNTAHIAHWTFNPETGMPWWSEELYRIYDRDPANGPLPYSEHPKLVHPDDWDWFDATVQNTAKTGEPFDIILRILRPDGSVRFINSICKPLLDDKGAVLEMRGTIQDITERERAESKLHESEEKFRLLAENSVDAIWQMDLRLNFTYISKSVYQITGHTQEEWIGTNLSKHTTRKEFFKMARQALGAIKNYKTFNHVNFEAVMLKKNGAEVPVEIIGKLLFNDKGLPVAIQGSTRDITDRKKAQDELLNSESRLRQIVENMPVMMDAFDENNNLVSWNRECERVTGYSKDEMKYVPEALEKLYPDVDYRNQMLSEMKKFDNNYRHKEYMISCKDGSCKTILWSNISKQFPVPGWHSWAIGLDVTEHRQAQEELKKYQEELEDLVLQRTKELEEKNTFLERMNDAMVDREFRIKELRDEIEQLKSLKNTEQK